MHLYSLYYSGCEDYYFHRDTSAGHEYCRFVTVYKEKYNSRVQVMLSIETLVSGMTEAESEWPL